MSAEGYEFWLIGLPKNENPKQFEKLRLHTKRQAAMFEFHIPSLRVGTLDLLFRASGDLQRLEKSTLDTLSGKVHTMREVAHVDREILNHCLQVEGRPMPQYLHKFAWCVDRFPNELSIPELQNRVERHVSSSLAMFQGHLEQYTAVVKKLEVIERSLKGSLMTRNISQLVKKEDFVLGSENLITLAVVVPNGGIPEWLNSYELLDEEVVPRSSKMLFEEQDFSLYSVTLFKRNLKNFTKRAREKRFIVRNFVFDEAEIQLGDIAHKDLKLEKVKLDKPLLRLFAQSFSEMYIALSHLYAMRLFVECILRYGLPVRYLFIFVVVPRGQIKNLRCSLDKLYSNLDLTSQEKKEEQGKSEEYYPYVCLPLRADSSCF